MYISLKYDCRRHRRDRIKLSFSFSVNVVLCSVFLVLYESSCALSWKPHDLKRGHGGRQGHGSHSRNSWGPPGGHIPGGNPGGRPRPPGPPGHPPGGSSGGHQGSSRSSSNDQNRDQVPVIPRCLMEEKAALISGLANRGLRNVTTFVPRCGFDHSFRCNQEWSAVGLSWQVDSEGRMVDKTLTKGTPKCPLQKDFRETLVCLHETKRFRCRPGAALSFGKIKLSRSPAPGDKCKHHHTRNEDNSTTPDGHQCNVSKVITNVHRRCQGSRECWIKLNERLLGKECVREVKYILVNYTCDREEARMYEEATYMRWHHREAEICLNDDHTFNIGDRDDGTSSDSDDVSDHDDNDDGDGNDDDDGADDDDDHDDSEDDDDDGDNDDDGVDSYDDNDGLSDKNDDDTFDDDVARFQRMGFLSGCGLRGRMGHDRHHHWGPGPSHHGRHHHPHHHHHHHCPRLSWIQQPDLYKEFKFNPPSVCPRNQPMQSNCNPKVCRLVRCGEEKNITCRINPCGTCRPECYDVNGNRAQTPRALTECDYKRLEIKHRTYDETNLVPSCNKDGSFAEIQCFPEAKVCWCVDEHGLERNGTRQTGKPRNCKVKGSVLSPCQSTQLNIRNLKEHLSKMAATYNETANDLKSIAENATQWTQQPPLTVPQNQSRHQQHAVRRQMFRVRVCRIIARETRRMEKYFIEPKCTADGKFESIQCGPSGKKCWCVDENGRMIGSMKPQEKLNCSNVHQGRPRVCPSVLVYGAAQTRPSLCRNNSDCPGSKVCCKTPHGRRGCVDPLPKMPAVKPGKCPAIPHSFNFTCQSKCKSDADCRGDTKCCKLGCGKRCIPANMPVCPNDKPFKLCIYDKCLSSAGCPGHPSARCHMNYCGECIAEYFDENGRKIDCSNATKCQEQRHVAIESYKRKFLQAFKTMPVSIPGAQHSQFRGGRQGVHWNGYGGSPSGEPGSGQRGRQDGGGSRGGSTGQSWGRPSGGRNESGFGGGQGGMQIGGHGGAHRGRQGGGSDGTQSGGQRGRSYSGGHPGGYSGGQWGAMGRQSGGSRTGGGAGGMHLGGQGGQNRRPSGGMGGRSGGSHAGGGGHWGRAGANGTQQGGQGGRSSGQRGGMRGRSGGSHGGGGAGGMHRGGQGGPWGGRRGHVGGQWRGMGGRSGGNLTGRGSHWGAHGHPQSNAGGSVYGRQNLGRSKQWDLGVFIPECNPKDGAFLAEQCNVTAGLCWCVDENGKERPNTRAQVQRGKIDCSATNHKLNVARDLQKGKEVHQKRKRVARMKIKLQGNFDDVVEKKGQFINNLKEKVLTICNCKKEQIQNVEIWRGSIIVKLEIVEDEEKGSLEESVRLIHTEVKSMNFVIVFEEKEYSSDGTFEAYVSDHHDKQKTKHTRRLSIVEIIAIGSCATLSLLGSAVFVWKYFGRSKKQKPEGWKDMTKEKPPEVQYAISEPGPTVSGVATSAEPPAVEVSVKMPEHSA